MAPGRGRKGETRMDAALDALVPMGFSKADIRKTVKKLLKVYGGTEGWVFIEDGHYKLLIEALLGGEDGSESGPPLLMNESMNGDNMDGDAGSSSAAGPSNAPEIPLEMIQPLMAAEKNCESHQDSDVSFPQQEFANRVFPSQTQHNPPSLTVRSPPPPPPPDSPPPPPPPPPAKRKPCYGWWGDESEDFICLPLMPVRPRTRNDRIE